MKEHLTDDLLIVEYSAWTKEYSFHDGFYSRRFIRFELENDGKLELNVNSKLADHLWRHTRTGFRKPSIVRVEMPLISSEQIRLEEERKQEIEKTKVDIERLKSRLRVLEAMDGKRGFYGED